MAYIKVNHSKFETAAVAIDNYVSLMKRGMTRAESEVTTLSSNWQGTDFTMFKSQWSKVTDSDSTYKQMKESLESYAKFLRYAGDKYKETQSKAVNRASALPKY